jgi:hypothetical protein
MNLHDPKTFAFEFFRVANDAPPSGPGSKDYTSWFEERMLQLARETNLYCQNRQSPTPSEWMKVDHVFVRENRYDSFPVIAVEHDNGDVSDDTKQGEIPDGAAKGAYVEWAFWKVLAMRANLGVIVAYPWKRDLDHVLSVLGRMATGFRREYDRLPPVLLLLGWWESKSAWRSDLYTPYVPKEAEGGKVEIVPLNL